MSLEHPSFLALDRHFLARRPANDVEAHVTSCAQCTEHLRQMAQGAALPSAMRARAATPVPVRRRRLTWQVPAALAALFFAVVSLRSVPVDEQTRTKGDPGVEVFIRRASAPAFIWNGKAALRAGDAIRLRALPSGYARVSVYGAKAELLWSAQFVDNQPLLSEAWELDGSPEPERLRVVFTHSPWTWQSLFAQDFALELTLPKDVAP